MTVTIRHGDCREVLLTLPEKSVHCCVTSPPYFGLRDYGTAQWEGGDPDCSHKQGRNGAGRADGVVDERGQRNRDGVGSMGGDCNKCGATRIDSQIGLEATPDAFVAEMVAVFREVRRVLRDDGTLWLNLGDSYTPVNRGENARPRRETMTGMQVGNPHADIPTRKEVIRGVAQSGMKQKDLMGIPWMVAFALRADGWYLRQDIIWSKPNPMPESVTDRCTKAHEYIFLMSKSARYFYDAEAIREPGAEPDRQRNDRIGGANGHLVRHSRGAMIGASATRNKRSVWEVATQPFSEAHFATFPPDLIEPCIKAGCPKGGTVLDLFGGAGTTGMVADRLGRNALLIELNPDYLAMAERRIRGDAGMFAEIL